MELQTVYSGFTMLQQPTSTYKIVSLYGSEINLRDFSFLLQLTWPRLSKDLLVKLLKVIWDMFTELVAV